MERLLGALTSRWAQGLVFGLLVIAVTIRSHAWWIAVGIVVGIFTVAMIAVGIVGLSRTRNAWRKFPNTPEYEEYAAKRDAERTENNKHKIELK